MYAAMETANICIRSRVTSRRPPENDRFGPVMLVLLALKLERRALKLEAHRSTNINVSPAPEGYV